ncbi:MAG: hypothetical protein ACOVQM_17170, partial [Pirellula sp.]
GPGSVFEVILPGRQLAANNDGAAPGEPLGFDSFLRHRFTQGGTFYVGVSNWLNTSYSATTGNNDSPSWQHAVGNYSLVINTTPTGRWMAAPDVAVASLPTVNEIAKTPTTAGTLDVRTEEVSFQARTSPAVPALAMEVIKETKSISSRTAANERLDDWFADFSKNFDDLSTFARV